MAEGQAASDGDLRRFVLEHHPIRGFWIGLDRAWRELRAFQHYPPNVEALLGETVMAATLLAATLKFEGRLTLQLQGAGQVQLLVAQCTHELEIRALARTDATVAADAGFHELVGRDGRLAVTIESEHSAMRHQGIVALDGGSLAECLEGYFENSEQLPTRLRLYADGTCARGVLVQQMPAAQARGQAEMQAAVWESLRAQLVDLPPAMLQLGTAEELLPQLCGAEDCRLFMPQAVRFACRCSGPRVAGLLRAMTLAELRDIVAERGAVTVTCEFCGRPYRFDAVDVERLFADGANPEGSRTLN